MARRQRAVRIPVLERGLEEPHLAFADHLGHEPHPVGAPAGGLPGLGLEQGLRPIEADGDKPVRSLQQRGFQPVRVVDGLQGGLTAHAKLAAVERVQGIALDLDHAPLAVLGNDAAAGRALPAGGRIPGGLTGHHVFRRLNQAVEVLGRLRAAAGSEGDAAQAGKFQERASIHSAVTSERGPAGASRWGAVRVRRVAVCAV